MIMELNGHKPDTEKALFIAENAVIIGDVTLEEGVSVWFGAVLRGDSGPIYIGKNSNVQDNCVVHNDAGTRVTVGENVTVGHGAILHGCTVKDNCIIGMGATIMNNSVISENSIVGAGALISEGKIFPEGSLIMGCPGKAVKPVSDEQRGYIGTNAQAYLEEAAMYLK